MLSANAIVKLHDQRTRTWHAKKSASREGVLRGNPKAPAETPDRPAELATLVVCQHRANFDLWHIEDEARAPGASDAELADVKRRIDTTNQMRNDLSEALDRMLMAWLEERGLPNPTARGAAVADLICPPFGGKWLDLAPDRYTFLIVDRA